MIRFLCIGVAASQHRRVPHIERSDQGRCPGHIGFRAGPSARAGCTCGCGRGRCAAVQQSRQLYARCHHVVRSGAALLRARHDPHLRIQSRRGGPILPRGRAPGSAVRRVLVGRLASDGAQHQSADGGHGSCRSVCRVPQGARRSRQRDSHRARAHRGTGEALRGATRAGSLRAGSRLRRCHARGGETVSGRS